jgi:cytochrome c peroxidase
MKKTQEFQNITSQTRWNCSPLGIVAGRQMIQVPLYSQSVNVLERAKQVHAKAEFQALLDFPPAPNLDLCGKPDSRNATESALRGPSVFFGQGQCTTCHAAPNYTNDHVGQ